MRALLAALPGLLWISLAGAADLPDSHDPRGLPRFPDAQVVGFVEGEGVERIYPQGPIRRISNRVRYERRVDARGRQTAVTYLLPAGHGAPEAFDFARKALLEQGAEPLYWCQGRDCGSSNLWANAVFGNATLYGSDDEQAYLLLRLAGDQADSLVALYGVTRGNRRAYLHAERLDADAPLGDLLPTAATLLKELRASGELTLHQVQGEPTTSWLELLASTLRADTTVRVALAGPEAERWREALIGEGIRAARLELEADGEGTRGEPAAPAADAHLRLVWLR